MSARNFRDRVYRYMEKAGIPTSFVKLYYEDGKYVAKFPGGIKIMGNPECDSLWVTWGSGHSAICKSGKLVKVRKAEGFSV